MSRQAKIFAKFVSHYWHPFERQCDFKIAKAGGGGGSILNPAFGEIPDLISFEKEFENLTVLESFSPS